MENALPLQLEKQAGSMSAAARMVGVSPQRFAAWKKATLSDDGELRIWLALNRPAALRAWLAQREKAAGA